MKRISVRETAEEAPKMLNATMASHDQSHLDPSSPTWVVLLGAGASVEAGYPLYRELTNPEALRARLSRFEDSHGEFADLLSRCAKISERQLHFEAFLREAVVAGDHALVQFALDYYHDLLTVPDFHLRTNIMRGFLPAFLRLPGLIAPVRTIILSLNHDLLVERSLAWEFYYPAPETDMTFRSCSVGENVTQPLSLGSKHYPEDYPRPQLSLVKLHGSLNWLRCSNCAHIVYSDVSLRLSREGVGLLLFTLFHPCPRCSRKGSWVSTLVPPVTEKDIQDSDPFWAIAKEAVSSASFVTIAGFSFPEYDLDVWDLLKAVGDPGGVEIIDPFPSTGTVRAFQLLTDRGIGCIPHRMTVKEYTRWQYRRFYDFDPFPEDCDEFSGPPQLCPQWL